MNIVMSRRQFISRLVKLNLFAASGVPTPPSLQLGTWVRYSWVNNDRIDPDRFGQTEYIIGRVTGYVWKHEEWSYYMTVTHSSYRDELFEQPEEFYADELEVLG
jgi:hypothetical protein